MWKTYEGEHLCSVGKTSTTAYFELFSKGFLYYSILICVKLSFAKMSPIDIYCLPAAFPIYGIYSEFSVIDCIKLSISASRIFFIEVLRLFVMFEIIEPLSDIGV